MAMREFADAAGVVWRVWDVRPDAAARARRERMDDVADSGPERRGRESWLVCECETERRRVSPIPSAWEHLSDAELEALCRAGDSRRTPARPIE